MGKRLGVTKSGRIMNPADRERKQMRLKELKRNKKERVKIRQSIVKSRNPRELIDHMERLDDQEFDLQNELALNVIADKRGKYRGAFVQMIALYRAEKDDKQVKELEGMLQEYELERFKKEQHYKAQLFSRSADPDEIPLPMGSMVPNAALTPYVPPPVAPQFHPIMKAGILKKSAVSSAKKHKYPPGPPCGLPPRFYDEEEEEDAGKEKRIEEKTDSSSRSRRVHFNESKRENRGADERGRGGDDDDLGPVEIPDSMIKEDNSAPPPAQNKSVFSRPILPPPIGTLIPPGMAPLPPRLPPNFPHMQMSDGMVPPRGFPPLRGPPVVPHFSLNDNEKQKLKHGDEREDEPNFSAVISAAPQVKKPSVDSSAPNAANVISAAPQMRNLKKETTRFVPTTLRVSRPAPTPLPARKMPAGGPGFHRHKPVSIGVSSSGAQPPNRSTDEACDEFLKEIQDLF